MKSKRYVKSISISNEAHDQVLFEGELEGVAFIGGSMLEVRGLKGVLRVELGRDEAERLMSGMSEVRA